MSHPHVWKDSYIVVSFIWNIIYNTVIELYTRQGTLSSLTYLQSIHQDVSRWSAVGTVFMVINIIE